MPLRVLYIDMNSYFASVEQQLRPELRGLPVVVAAVDVDSTCCIAASYEAKQFGIRTGTPVWQVRQIKSIQIVEARPHRYVAMHQKIARAIETCLPIQAVHSIDEFSCRLSPAESEPSAAKELALRVKRAIYSRAGVYLRCSVGLAPNRFIAKVAADMEKPDGLVALTETDLPEKLYSLKLDDLAGIGPRMLKRLNQSGIGTIAHLYQFTESQMKEIWGGVAGQRWWHWLRGYDLPELPTRKTTLGHSHVLPPSLRTEQGARGVLIRLIHKAAMRLRRINYWAGRMEVYVSFTFREEGWSGSVALGMCQDTQSMLEAFHQLWQHLPQAGQPMQVAITLYDLTSSHSAALPLYPSEQRRLELSRVVDQLNQRFGPNHIYFGGMHDMKKTAPMRIAFSQIPDLKEEGIATDEEFPA